MKGNGSLNKIYGNALQKQMDADMEDFMIYEQEQYQSNRGVAPIRSIDPAYMDGDVFEYQKNQQRLKAEQQARETKRQESHLIQPDKVIKTGRVFMVEPDDE